MKLEIVTPEKKVYSDSVDQVTLLTPNGQITILPNHIPLVTQVKPGELIIKKSDKVSHLVTGEGFVEVTGTGVSVMTDLAENFEGIDEKAVEEAKKRAQEALKHKQAMSNEDFALTAATLEKSLAQLKFKRKHRSRDNFPKTNN
jgi:F-type H+-transporting ATPase subunit epsilon